MPKYSRYSRKYKRGGRPPNTSTDNARGNEQPVEYAERDNSNREYNTMEEPPVKQAKLEIGEVDPNLYLLRGQELAEYKRQLDEGNRLAYRKKFGRQGDFTRIYDEADEDKDDDKYPDYISDYISDYPQHEGGRKRRKTTKRRKSTKRRKTMKRRKTTKRRKN
jgi:hypothetical protein